jgi:RNA recognition motif-containing protein
MSIRVFVGNLAYDVTETELRALFLAAGQPSSVHLPSDRETGKPRGFAFVEFSDRAEAEEAIRSFNQMMFKGRALVVNEARPREEASGPRARTPSVRPSWSADASPGDTERRPNQPRGTFGPDARPRGKRKHEGRGPKEERAPKGPLRERAGGQLFFGSEEDDDREEDSGADDFTLGARRRSKPQKKR